MFPTVHGVVAQVLAATGGGGGDAYTLISALPGSLGGSAAQHQYGWAFTLSEAVEATGARVLVNGTGPETVRVWRASDQALLGSVEVTPVDDTWTAADFASPIALAAGVEYRIAIRRTDNTSRTVRTAPVADVTFAPTVTFIRSYLAASTAFPNGSLGTSTLYGLVDLNVVPS